jgi:mono/diheme cytochrome c family protein
MMSCIGVRRALRIVCAAGLLASSPPLACAQDDGDAKRGRQFAEKQCAGCHAIAPGQRRQWPTGQASFQEIADTPGMTGIALNVWLRTPHKTMPNLVVAPDDGRDVIAYILSLKSKP